MSEHSPSPAPLHRLVGPFFSWKDRVRQYGLVSYDLFAGSVRIGNVCLRLSGGGYVGTTRLTDSQVSAETKTDCMDALESLCRKWFELSSILPNAKLTGPTPEPAQRTDVDGSGPAPCWALPSDEVKP
jgi:hypothetical protein